MLGLYTNNIIAYYSIINPFGLKFFYKKPLSDHIHFNLFLHMMSRTTKINYACPMIKIL